jgi:hypothetical protein
MKRFHYLLLLATVSLVHSAIFGAQDNSKPENATAHVLRAFETHDIVMIGEIHSNKQEYDWFVPWWPLLNLPTGWTTLEIHGHFVF